MELADVPTLYVDFLEPESMRFGTSGNAMDGGRNGLGESISIEMSGGGLVTGAYLNCNIYLPEQNEYINYLAARLNGGFRAIDVPIKTDGVGPFVTLDRYMQPIIRTTHSDGSPHSDGAPYSQPSVYGQFAEDAPLNAGIVKIRLFGAARELRWSDWFSVDHSMKGNRAYRYWQVIAKSDEDNPVYTLAVTPPLRQAVTAGEFAEFVRPTCVMKFKTGFSLDWDVSGFYRASPSLQFVEAF